MFTAFDPSSDRSSSWTNRPNPASGVHQADGVSNLSWPKGIRDYDSLPCGLYPNLRLPTLMPYLAAQTDRVSIPRSAFADATETEKDTSTFDELEFDELECDDESEDVDNTSSDAITFSKYDYGSIESYLNKDNSANTSNESTSMSYSVARRRRGQRVPNRLKRPRTQIYDGIKIEPIDPIKGFRHWKWSNKEKVTLDRAVRRWWSQSGGLYYEDRTKIIVPWQRFHDCWKWIWVECKRLDKDFDRSTLGVCVIAHNMYTKAS